MSINIEAETMLNMAKRQILPAGLKFAKCLADEVTSVAAADVEPKAQKKVLEKVNKYVDSIDKAVDSLEKALVKAQDMKDVQKQAELYKSNVVPAMNALRAPVDDLERVIDADIWPLPTYAEMLFC